MVNRSVPRISWDQVRRVSEPGRYQFMFGFVTITPDDLEIWSRYPAATFALYEAASEGGHEYRLGSVNLNSLPDTARSLRPTDR